MQGHDVAVSFAGPIEPFGSREQLEGFLDQVMDELLTCDIVDPTVGETYSEDGKTVTIEFTMAVEVARPDEAVTQAMNAVRSSLHALRVSTPGWEDLIERMRSDVRSSQVDGDLIDA